VSALAFPSDNIECQVGKRNCSTKIAGE